MLWKNLFLTAFFFLGAFCLPVSADNIVFVTNGTYDGNFGGVAAVDQRCQNSAAAAGLPGTYRAWISATTTDPGSRLIHSISPYRRVNGTIVADNWTDLADGTLDAPINLSETGVDLTPSGNTSVWTATLADLTYFGQNCNNAGGLPDWSTSLGRTMTGVLTSTDSNWTAVGVNPCAGPRHLYCIQQVPNPTAAFDMDGDGKTDLSIFRPGPGEWWYNRSSNGGNRAFQFGAGTDTMVPADFTGDGATDVAFFRPSTGQWFVLRSENLSFYAFPFGTNGDVPVPADYDADGKADAAVYRPSTFTWFIQKSGGGTDILGFGAAGDVPTVADYDGDAKADIAIYRPNAAGSAQWWVRRSSNGTVFALQFGTATDKTVQGDYTGDRKADIAFWRPSNGNWFVLRSEDFSFYAVPFGSNGDIPVPGDYDGDGRNDTAIFRPSSATWFAQRSTAGTLIQQFGITSDIPLPSAYVR